MQLEWGRKQTVEIDLGGTSWLDRCGRDEFLTHSKHVVLFAVRHGEDDVSGGRGCKGTARRFVSSSWLVMASAGVRGKYSRVRKACSIFSGVEWQVRSLIIFSPQWHFHDNEEDYSSKGDMVVCRLRHCPRSGLSSSLETPPYLIYATLCSTSLPIPCN